MLSYIVPLLLELFFLLSLEVSYNINIVCSCVYLIFEFYIFKLYKNILSGYLYKKTIPKK